MNEGNFVCLTDNRALVVIPFHEKVYFKGKVRLCGVHANGVEVLGSKFDSSSNLPVDIFSPRGYSLLCFESIKSEQSQDLKKLNSKEDRKLVKGILQQNSEVSIIVLEKLDSCQWTHYLDSALAFSDPKRQKIALFGREKWVKDTKIVPDSVEEALDISLIAPNEFLEVRARFFEANPEWENAVLSCKIALDNKCDPKLVAAGGKGVGKSTMLKFVTNRLVQSLGRVIWIDLDPGQAEFTLPGCLSAVLVDSSLLGPNFTHALTGNSVIINLFLGTVNVSDVANRYINSVEAIIDCLTKREDLKGIPWVVNTMGFNHGLGVSLLKKCANLIQPTTFVEIKSRFHKKNFECSLSEFCSQSLRGCNFLSFSAMPESSVARDMGGSDLWGIPEAYKLRDIVVLSYLGRSFSAPIQSLTPYEISFEALSVQLIQCSRPPPKPEVILNMALVSLGSYNGPKPPNGILPNNTLVATKGFGIIRAVDQVKKMYFIVTNLSPDELTQINCMSCGSIFLPKGVYLSQTLESESAPYLETNPKLVTPLNTTWQRSAGRPQQN